MAWSNKSNGIWGPNLRREGRNLRAQVTSSTGADPFSSAFDQVKVG